MIKRNKGHGHIKKSMSVKAASAYKRGLKPMSRITRENLSQHDSIFYSKKLYFSKDDQPVEIINIFTSKPESFKDNKYLDDVITDLIQHKRSHYRNSKNKQAPT